MSKLNSGKIKITNDGNIIMQFSNYHHVIDSDTELCYKHQADKVIAELEEERRWRSVSEELPKLEEDVAEDFLVVVEHESNTSPKGSYVTSADYYNGEWYRGSDGNELDENIELEDCFYHSKVTHWMPLPNPPEEAK